ncbi:unnamed protein product [Calicophoron daubneyi]|uniref:Poly(A) RNA polymerase mitochondrial-like central palm domain-containing protein n=1 Tax=Calicophoron daubneyi TaxID=300641 RepID=A0AAV2TQ96_CALDB
MSALCFNSTMNISMSALVAAAQRSVLFACAPVSLPFLVKQFERYCDGERLKHAFYWPHQDRTGVALLEADSKESLQTALSRLSAHHRTNVRGAHLVGASGQTIQLPFFRICSDPSCWPAESSGSSQPNDVQGFLHSRSVRSDVIINQPPISARSLYKKLLCCTTISDQTSTLFQSTRMTYPDLLARLVIPGYIEEVLRSICPDARVSIFGSAINGLGSSSSDLDLVVHVDSKAFPTFVEFISAGWNRSNSKGPIGYTKLGQRVTLQPFFLSLLRRLLRRVDPLGFHKAELFRGYIPILHLHKFGLLGTGVDISCTFDQSASPLKQSFHSGCLMDELLRAFTVCVPDFPKYISILKFIARNAKLTRDGPSYTFTNFKLTVLFINFLQTCGYAPPFEQLVSIWESVTTDPDKNPIISTLIPLPSLEVVLEQFFTYVITLNPSHFTLSLRSGRLYPRSKGLEPVLIVHPSSAVDFQDTMYEPKHDSDYVLCPNPIDPNRNMLHGIGEDEWSEFVRICDNWVKILHIASSPVSSSKAEKWGLLALERCPERRAFAVGPEKEEVDKRSCS